MKRDLHDAYPINIPAPTCFGNLPSNKIHYPGLHSLLEQKLQPIGVDLMPGSAALLVQTLLQARAAGPVVQSDEGVAGKVATLLV